MKIANFEKRLFSYLIDMIFPLALSIISIIFFNKYVFIKINFFKVMTFLGFLYLYFYLINSFLCYVSNGFTLGNACLKIKTIQLNEERITYKTCFLKYSFLSLLPCVILNACYMLLKHTEMTIFDQISSSITISLNK